MAPILAGILLEAATKFGAPIIKEILQKHIGGTAGELGGVIIDAIAGAAGVTPDEIPTLPQDKLGGAIQTVEQNAPALILAGVEQQKEANRLMLAEMDKGSFFAWGWRPAFMWLLGFLWAWALVFQPVTSALTRSELGHVDLPMLLSLTGIFMSLYMGGHTLKSVLGNK